LPLAFAVAACFVLADSGSAQVRDSLRRPGVGARPGAQAGRAGQGARGALKQQRQQEQALAGANRPALERQVRQALARVVRKQLNLNDQQMQSLARVDQKYDFRRFGLLRDERLTRQNLKAAMIDSTPGDSAAREKRIAQYIDQLTQAQRQRADLLIDEQKELSDFLTPMQRAQYLSLKERVTARVLQMQAGANVDGQGGGRRGVPPLEP
jgi:hypothetical protein